MIVEPSRDLIGECLRAKFDGFKNNSIMNVYTVKQSWIKVMKQ